MDGSYPCPIKTGFRTNKEAWVRGRSRNRYLQFCQVSYLLRLWCQPLCFGLGMFRTLGQVSCFDCSFSQRKKGKFVNFLGFNVVDDCEALVDAKGQTIFCSPRGTNIEQAFQFICHQRQQSEVISLSQDRQYQTSDWNPVF